MPSPNQIKVQSGDSLLLVGTMKGAFLFRGDAKRERWEEAGPYFPGRSVYALTFDGRNGRQKLWAAVNSPYWGSFLSSSNDSERRERTESYNIKFPEGQTFTKGLADVRIARSRHALLRSRTPHLRNRCRRDLVAYRVSSPSTPQWPGGGGLAATSFPILRVRRMFVAISTGGVYRTDDGGENWQPRNKGICARFMPPDQQYPEWGQCVHKVVSHPSKPDRMFLQHHWGVYRSDDAGDSWQDIGKGLPSDFGFAMEMDPHEANTVYIIPIESDEFRCTPEAKLRVYRTKDGGESWEPLTKGLPQEDAWETILRDNLSSDSHKPTGLYFGTRSGKSF